MESNIFLDGLPHGFLPLNAIEFKPGQVLFDTGDTVTDVYFPFDAVISLIVTLGSGENIETAMLGRNAAVGALSALDGGVSHSRATVQLGGRGMRCEVSAFRKVASQNPALLSLALHHERSLLAQVQQAAVCNLTHQLECRLARWLLLARDLSGRAELTLTQDTLADLLGVRRTSLSLAASTLRRAGNIRYSRGRIQITDAGALKERACECYQTVKLQCDQPFTAAGGAATSTLDGPAHVAH